MVSVVEIKATGWDRILPHRVNANIRRHVRQVWRYVEPYLLESDVCPAIIYPAPPTDPSLREHVEERLNEEGIQVVWHSES